MTIQRRTLLGATVAGPAILSSGVASAQARGPIRIAMAGPLTGANATFGAQIREGVNQAVIDFNAAGGVLGQQLAMETGDDACDPRQAVSVANQLAGRQLRSAHQSDPEWLPPG